MASFEDLFVLAIELALLLPSYLLDGFVHKSRDLVMIKKNGHMREVFFYRRDKHSIHVNGDGLKGEEPILFLP
jgi:hypothetical protein